MAAFSIPGVYIHELDAVPNSVSTAVPAFIGYTPRADYEGKSFFNKAQKITSLRDFQSFFMLDDPLTPADPARQYSPEYYLVLQGGLPDSGEYVLVNGACHSILPDPATVYYLYNSVRLFYLNGGGDAYIVSVGPYGPASKQPMTDPSFDVVNPNVQLNDLLRGLALLINEQEPTMVVFPEATLLSLDDNGTLMQKALAQAALVQTVICLFDVIGGAKPDSILYSVDIQNFRDRTGAIGLEYGACYYPFIGTSVMQPSEIDFTNLFGGDTRQLLDLLSPPSAPNADVNTLIGMIQSPPAVPMSNSQLQAALLVASPTYGQIMQQVISSANVLPASAAMAGIITLTDNMHGVWQAPANIGIVGSVSLPIRLSDQQQENLNDDPLWGKSINAIRFFNGQGILVWGARTLDGNGQDWRYIAARRTMTFIEQSVKLATRAYIFQPNIESTWSALNSMISSFLNGVWSAGGLPGASPAEAFQVDVGPGTGMAADDLSNRYMQVSVRVAMIRPAEFIAITYSQQQASP